MPTNARMALAGSVARSQGARTRSSPGRLSRRCRTHCRTSKACGAAAGGGAAAGVGGCGAAAVARGTDIRGRVWRKTVPTAAST
eukprot:963469-Alexandrium_andersonii.AAC.1